MTSNLVHCGQVISRRSEVLATTLTAISAFSGFVAMCVWAKYSNNNQHEYGACFILVILSWMCFLMATAAGIWETANGFPEVVKRGASLCTCIGRLGVRSPVCCRLVYAGAVWLCTRGCTVTVFSVEVLFIIGAALTNWSHGQYIVVLANSQVWKHRSALRSRVTATRCLECGVSCCFRV